MRPIDANVLEEHKFPLTPLRYHAGWNDAIDAVIENAPTIDAVPVVRCKDCKYWASHGNDEILGVEDGVCCCDQWENDYYNIETVSDDFCSYGERRSDA